MNVQVITDSTADLPEGTTNETWYQGCADIPAFWRKDLPDGVDITKDEFYSMLASSPFHPASSQPNPEDFTNMFEEYCGNKEV